MRMELSQITAVTKFRMTYCAKACLAGSVGVASSTKTNVSDLDCCAKKKCCGAARTWEIDWINDTQVFLGTKVFPRSNKKHRSLISEVPDHRSIVGNPNEGMPHWNTFVRPKSFRRCLHDSTSQSETTSRMACSIFWSCLLNIKTKVCLNKSQTQENHRIHSHHTSYPPKKRGLAVKIHQNITVLVQLLIV